MCEICVNTHTHTHTHTHTASSVSSRVNIRIIIHTCKGGNSFLQGFPPFFRIHIPLFIHYKSLNNIKQ